MSKKISEFIQEQESNDLSLYENNDYVAAYCECAAAAHLTNYYAEMGQLVAFASENDINLFGVIQEEAEEGKKNIFQKLGGGIKNLWTKFVEFLKGVIGKIKDFFAGKKLEAAEKKLGEADPGTQITIDQRVLYPYVIIAMCKKIVSGFDDAARSSSGDATEMGSELVRVLAPINKDFDDMGSGKWNIKDVVKEEDLGMQTDFDYELRNDGRITLTVGAFKKILADVKSNKMKNETDRIKIRLDEMKKKMENALAASNAEIKDSAEYKYTSKWDGGTGAGTKEKLDKQMASDSKKVQLASAAITKTMNHITKVFDGMMTTYNNIAEDVQSLIKKNPGATGVENVIGKPKDEAKAESFYFV